MEFQIEYLAGTILCTAVHDVEEKLIRYWFLGQILPLFLLFNGATELLHATAMVTPLGAVALLGRSGIGKSTLLSHGLAQGAYLITDEHLALRRSDYTRAIPSIPFYRPYRSVEDLGDLARHFQRSPVVLKSMYLLEPDYPDAPVTTTKVSSADTVSALLMNQQYNLYSPRVPELHGVLADRFAGLAALTRAVPLKRLHVPRSLRRLSEVYDFINNDLRNPA